MNTLAYGLLSLISGSPCTGYDLTRKVQYFWHAQHSQIYPLLAKLEEQGYLRYELVAQTDKPDKKIYTITAEGREQVKRWIGEPTDCPVVRDEFSLKLFSLSLADREAAKKLLGEREKHLEEKLNRLHLRLEELRTANGGDSASIPYSSPLFGVSILIDKSIAVTRTEIDWCRRVIADL